MNIQLNKNGDNQFNKGLCSKSLIYFSIYYAHLKSSDAYT